MELRLTVEGSPPSGLLHRGAEPPLPFAGWLELLRVLSLTVGGEESRDGSDGTRTRDLRRDRPHP
jgi:hypothetical protein